MYPSALTHLDGAGSRLSFPGMAAAEAVQTDGLARPVTQQRVNVRFCEALLPAPDHRTAAADAVGDALNRTALARLQDDPCPLGMLERGVAIRRNRLHAGGPPSQTTTVTVCAMATDSRGPIPM